MAEWFCVHCLGRKVKGHYACRCGHNRHGAFVGVPSMPTGRASSRRAAGGGGGGGAGGRSRMGLRRHPTGQLRGDGGHGPPLAEPVKGQRCVHLAVVDFEATCFPTDRAKQRSEGEIIEFPTILFRVVPSPDGTDYRLVPEGEWREYVQPVRNPQLSAFCTQLTGIAQATVDAASTFPTVLEAHMQWLRDRTGDASLDSVLFLTCGDWDLAEALPRDAAYHRLHLPPAYRRWANVKCEFAEFFGMQSMGMAGMLGKLGLPLIGHHHSGLDDTRNISKIVQELWGAGHTTFSVRRRAL